jgi:HAD superfamily hydrolase (TIGR01549 family)
MPTAPRALLLDFGGVLVDAPARPPAIATLVADRLRAAGVPVPSTVDSDVRAGFVAYAHWREATVRLPAPAEVPHREFWAEYVAADWPASARAVVAAAAAELCYEIIRFDPDLPPRQGIPELLDEAAARGLGLGIVSNTMCGAAHRDYLAGRGLTDRFGVQLYSDEAGIRKPHPELIRRAAKALGAVPEECWYVGDTWSRDVRCGRRAGVGTAVLMRSSRTATEARPADLAADLVVADPAELRAALSAASP